MHKSLFTSLAAGTMALFLISACAEDSKGTDNPTAQASATENTAAANDQGDSIMDQPVDFSTPENVEKALQNVREQESDRAYKNMKSAMQYVQYYDLSLGNSKEKLHQKLDGKTPNEIIAMMKR